jgi:hypothetical protein
VCDTTDAHVLRIRGLHLILLERLHLDDVPGRITRGVLITGELLGDYNSM